MRVMTTVRDFAVPLAGLPIAIERTYDSLERSVIGDFGFGWKLAINSARLTVGPAAQQVTLTMNGQRKTSYFTPVANGIFQFFYVPAWTGEPGFYGSMAATGDNCGGVVVRVGNVYALSLIHI